MRNFIEIVQNAGRAPLQEGETARLIDLYGEAELEDETETISHFVGPEDYEVALPIKTISAADLTKLRTAAGDMSVIEAFEEFAEPSQVKIVKEKMKAFEADRVIVLDGDRVIDGNHHVLAAYRHGRPVKAIDLEGLGAKVFEAFKISDYLDRGLSPEEASRARTLRLKPSEAKYAKDNKHPLEDMAKWVSDDRKTSSKRRLADARFQKVRDTLGKLAVGSGPLAPSTVVMMIADDDDLFDALAHFTTDDPDRFTDDHEAAQKIERLLRRMKPRSISSPLWRGECAYSERRAHRHAFHSWTPSQDAARHFMDCGRDAGTLRKLMGPFRGFSIAEIVDVRMRLRPGESHYSGGLSEWLVLDQK